MIIEPNYCITQQLFTVFYDVFVILDLQNSDQHQKITKFSGFLEKKIVKFPVLYFILLFYDFGRKYLKTNLPKELGG